MGPILVNKPFPAEHPYSSHMPRTALFPTFESSMDPKRGVAARYQRPISDEMPAKAYNVQIVHKTKGFGDRREIQDLPRASEKEGLEWNGEYGFNQLVKVHGGRQEFYPIPPKTVAPNLQNRAPDMRLSDRSANAIRNVERDQWQTTYDRSHTGIGPANPNKLDNFDDKTKFQEITGIRDDALYPNSINTLDPPRPLEGRIAKKLVPKPPQMPSAAAANAPENPNYIRMKTLSEREEERLLYGKEYTNLPDDVADREGHQWRETERKAHSQPNLDILAANKGQPTKAPYTPAGPPSGKEAVYLESTKRDQDKNFQEIEAQNRWNVLNNHTPAHDISSLNYKMTHTSEPEKPATFYGHEGKYNEQRAGLYKTDYTPERLAYSMNALEASGPELANTRLSHVNALSLPTKLNHDMKDAFRYSRTLSASQPNLAGDRREPREFGDQYQSLKQFQKGILQPNAETARVKVQEGETILKESTMGDSFNTHKFLQDNQIGKFARNEPLQVMSRENQNLNAVRKASSTKSKNVTFSDNITVAQSLDSGIIRFSSAPTRGSPRVIAAETSAAPGEPVNTTQYSSVHAQYDPKSEEEEQEDEEGDEKEQSQQKVKFFNIDTKPDDKQKPQPQIAYSNVLRKRPVTTNPSSEYRNEFSSKGTNFIPSNLQHTLSFNTAYQAQFPSHDLGYKYDPRFSWQPGHGTPRPQTSLLDIQIGSTSRQSGAASMDNLVRLIPT